MRVVLVTGAGASRSLGADGPLPLMGGWAAALRYDLNHVESGLADAIGLKDQMSGPEFEEALGALLRWQDMRSLNERFRGLGGQQLGKPHRQILTAANLESDRLEKVMSGVNESLFEVFGAAQIDEQRASAAFGNLISMLDDPDDLTVVTTNYDPAAEIALTLIGRSPDTGFSRQPGRAPQLAPAGLVKRTRATKGAVAVLHLHGAVGWYEQDGVVREQHQDLPFNPTLGRPVVLYPDPAKDPTRDALVRELWDEFDAALDGATHVIVLGHSLHDSALVDRLRRAAQSARVAICAHARAGEPTAGEPDLVVDQDKVDRFLELVPGRSNVVPVDFGPDRTGQRSISSWLEMTANK